jgi:hypothetical protein
LLRRRTADDDRVYADERVREETERTGTSPGLVRAIATLLGVAAAGLLIWIAQAVTDGPIGDQSEATRGEYWLAVALLAGAGLVLGLSQLFGGWTKWGWPTISPAVFLLGFLPTLVVGGWILLAKQAGSDAQESRVQGWSEDIGIAGLVNDLATFLPAIPLVVGLVLAFSFDTTGPRTQRLRREPVLAADYEAERTAAYEGERTAPTATRTDATRDRETTVAEDLRRRDRPVDTVGARTADERADVDRRTT